MKKFIGLVALTTVTAGGASAGGIDRSGQPMALLFKKGNYAEISGSKTSPDVSGTGVSPFTDDYDDVADDFTSYGFGIKYDVNEKLSVALMGSEDFGTDIAYDGSSASTWLGGTSAEANTYALTLMARYKLDDNWSVHGGVRRDVADGDISLGGLAYGPVNGYNVKLDSDVGYGYLIGGAYEIPEIAFRLAVTYNSRIRHDFKSTETLNGASLGDSDDTQVDTPQSVNIDFQTGVAERTLVFANIRWAEWSEFEIAPEVFNSVTDAGLVSLEDTTTYTLGVGHRFTDRFAGSAAFIYEAAGDELVSPLRPTTGYKAIALGASYRMDQYEISGGVRYTWLGDAKPETGTPDVARADFTDNEAISVGIRFGYYF